MKPSVAVPNHLLQVYNNFMFLQNDLDPANPKSFNFSFDKWHWPELDLPPYAFWSVLLISAILSAFFCMQEAKKKERSQLWFLAGLLFNVFAVLIIIAASNPFKEAKSAVQIEHTRDDLKQLQKKVQKLEDLFTMLEKSKKDSISND